MNPIHFGSLARVLFGMYHPAARRPVRPEGVVVCPPWGKEYMRTHRVLRTIALELARRGHHVLRFDYHGTGDSGGVGLDVRLDRSVEDVGLAVEELESLAGVARVTLLGVRAGGAAAVLASRTLSQVERLVLWDPVVQGSAYLDALVARAREPTRGGGESEALEPGVMEVDGYPLSAEHRRQLRGLDLTDLDATSARQIHIVSTGPVETQRLDTRLSRLRVSLYRKTVLDRGLWSDPDRLDDLILSPAVVKEIVACAS